MLDGLAILGVELFDFSQFTLISAIISDELSRDSDWLCAVNLEVGARTKKVLVAQAVGLDVTAILVTQTLEAVRTIVATIRSRASLLNTL